MRRTSTAGPAVVVIALTVGEVWYLRLMPATSEARIRERGLACRTHRSLTTGGYAE